MALHEGGTLRRGHPGSANLRAAVRAHAPGYGQVDSQRERRFRTLLLRRGIELPGRNQELGRWTVDCLWLRRHRYLVRRYATRQLDERPDDVIADLLDALAQADTLGYAS
jgi:hypothetical protein